MDQQSAHNYRLVSAGVEEDALVFEFPTELEAQQFYLNGKLRDNDRRRLQGRLVRELFAKKGEPKPPSDD